MACVPARTAGSERWAATANAEGSRNGRQGTERIRKKSNGQHRSWEKRNGERKLPYWHIGDGRQEDEQSDFNGAVNKKS